MPRASLTGLSGLEWQLSPLISLLNSQVWASGNHTAAAEQGEDGEETTKAKIKSLKS